ncbi:MAG: PKD domain-containing protein [Planctomycetota bacterium]|nr:PKD domain-containing protein [Planctomycetota bacterium]
MRFTRYLPIVLAAAVLAGTACAFDSWPGESWSASTNLSQSGWTNNMSGAYWNPVTRRLWVACNSGWFSVLKENGAGGFVVESTYSPSDYPDLEGITQANPSADRVYLMVERANTIREYVVSTGALNQSWDLTSLVGNLGNDGTEGIAFIPNSWLAASGFRDGSGNLYTQSAYGSEGLGGIMLVAVQDTARATAGYVYAVDLKTDGTGTYTTVGKYKTNRNESCDLAFDASIGRLYILHNLYGGNNCLEVTDLTSSPYGSDRKFTTLREFQVPGGADYNVEGFGLTPALTTANAIGDRWCFFTDDDNNNGNLRWFKQFPSPLSVNLGDNQSAPVSTAVSVRPSVLVQDAFKNLLPNVAVTFTIASGGGTITGGSTTTNSFGIATVGSWTLGPGAGANTLSVTCAGFSGTPLTFTATGTASSLPTVTSIVRQNPAGASTNAASVTWHVTFSEHVNGVGTGDFTLVDVVGSISGESITGVSASSGTTIDVTAGTGSGDGTLRLDVLGTTAIIMDDDGNSLTASFTSGETYTIDKTRPGVSIGAPSASLTRTGPITYTIAYTGADTVTLTTPNVTLNTTGTATGAVAVSVSSPSTRTVTISSITGDGTLGISIAAGTASDNAGNQALAAGPSTTFTVDNTRPGVSIGAPSASLTQTGPITYTITYTGADTVTLTTPNVTLNTTGTANGTVAASGSGTSTRTVTISSITGDGTLGISIAAGTASDNAGNQALAAGPSATFTVDNTPAPANQAPIVSAGQNQSITLPASAQLEGTVSDDGLPQPPGAVTVQWSEVSGPGTATFANAASLSTTAAFSVAGTYVVRLTANDGELSAGASVTVQVGAAPGNTPPQLTSPVTASPATAVAGQTVTFSVGAGDPDGDALSYMWNFGDGTPQSGIGTHVYTVAGTYTATVTILDSKGGTLTSSATITVTGGGSADTDGDGLANDVDSDDDNDGVSDANESADGTDPLDPHSAAKVPMYVTKLKGSARFDQPGHDSVAVSGVIPSLPALFDPKDKAVTIDIGGATHDFRLDGKGKANAQDGSFQLKMKFTRNKTTKKLEFRGGNVPFTATVKGALADDWLDEGVNPSVDSKKQNLSVSVDLWLNGRVYTASLNTLYSAKAGQCGTFSGIKKIALPK